MISSYRSTDDRPLVHQFIRRYGRRPTAEELARYQASQVRVLAAAPARIRRHLARIILRS